MSEQEQAEDSTQLVTSSSVVEAATSVRATARPWWNESGVIHASDGRGGATHPARCDKEDDAKLIVRAVNNHDALVKELAYWVEHVETSTMPETVALKGWLGSARAALDAAKEEVE